MLFLNYIVGRTLELEYFDNNRVWYDKVKMEAHNYYVFFEWTEKQYEELIGFLDVAYLGLD